MNLTEMMNQIKAIREANEDNYSFIGMRFENKERELNEICECSKNNTERADEREFPEYGTDEYNENPSFDGTSAWNLNDYEEAFRYNIKNPNSDMMKSYEQDHCYIIAGNYSCNGDDGLDDNEVVIEDAKVIAIIF